MIETRRRRQALLETFRKGLPAILPPDGSTTIARDRARIVFPDGTYALIHLAFVSRAHKPGDFGVYLSLIIGDGTVWRALTKSGLRIREPDKRVYSGTSYGIIPRGITGYKIGLTTDIERVGKRIIGDIKKHFLPIIRAFTGAYSEALDYVRRDPGFAARPFSLCVVLLELAGHSDRIQKLMSDAEKNKAFWDLHSARSPHSLVTKLQAGTNRVRARDASL